MPKFLTGLLCSIELDWQRGRIFDPDVACAFQRLVSDAGSLKVTSVVSSEERRHRPHGSSLHFTTLKQQN